MPSRKVLTRAAIWCPAKSGTLSWLNGQLALILKKTPWIPQNFYNKIISIYGKQCSREPTMQFCNQCHAEQQCVGCNIFQWIKGTFFRLSVSEVPLSVANDSGFSDWTPHITYLGVPFHCLVSFDSLIISDVEGPNFTACVLCSPSMKGPYFSD